MQKSSTKKFNKNIIFIIALACFAFILNKCSKPDLYKERYLIQNVMKSISNTTNFRLVRRIHPNSELISSGSLGEFYTCLEKYRDISYRKTDKKGISKRLDLWVDDNIYFYMNSREGEVYSFTVRIINEDKREVESTSYSINCDYSLLNALKAPTGKYYGS